MKGKLCSVSGKKYESEVLDICKKIYYGENKPFSEQETITGTSNDIDIKCKYEDISVGIEVKVGHSPDWSQMSIIKENNVWKSNKKTKSSDKIKIVFNSLLIGKELFNGKIPPFLTKNIKHESWKNIKKNDKSFKDMYFDVPNDTINNLYFLKGCSYIQISNFGLYHLFEDICDLGTPKFICEQEMRIRTKIHRRKCIVKDGEYMSASITASIKPKNIKKELKKSNVSLDKNTLIPKNFKIKN